MSNYKKIMIDKGIMHKELLENIKRVDNRVDKSLLSKIVNDVCLPTPKVFDAMCDFINCKTNDIYDSHEIDFHCNTPQNTNNLVVITRQDRGGLSHGKDVYNLTVEINRSVAERVFSKQALQKLGYKSKTDCIRKLVSTLDIKYRKILEKEKAVKDYGIYQDD